MTPEALQPLAVTPVPGSPLQDAVTGVLLGLGSAGEERVWGDTAKYNKWATPGRSRKEVVIGKHFCALEKWVFAPGCVLVTAGGMRRAHSNCLVALEWLRLWRITWTRQ